MNRFQAKFKQYNPSSSVTSIVNTANNNTEDSSDYISSDIESNSAKFLKTEQLNDSNQHQQPSQILEDSNDSFYDRYSTAKVNMQQSERPSSRLVECLDYLHRMIGRKDKDDIFGLPVTDDIAPGYSLIIKNPMDLSTMKKKIDGYCYNTVSEYRDDLILMCENCMTYNKSDTIYYHAAKKLLDYGLKLLSRDKLISLRNTIRIMRYLTPNELGFTMDGTGGNDGSNSHLGGGSSMTPDVVFHDSSNHGIGKQRGVGGGSSNSLASQLSHKSQQSPSTYTSRIGQNNSIIISKAKILQKIEALHHQQPYYHFQHQQQKESYLVPPEGEDDEDNDDEYYEEMAEEVKELAAQAAERLAAKNQNGKMGFLRRNSNGTTGYNFLNDDDDEQPSEKVVTIGNLCEGLQPNLYTMASFLEDKKNKSKPMNYIENGPFSSHAPVYDTSYSNLSKEELNALQSTYGDEASYQYALSLMDFGKNTSQMFSKYVNLVLNTLTTNEHDKYLQQMEKIKEETSLALSNNSTSLSTNEIASTSVNTNISNELATSNLTSDATSNQNETQSTTSTSASQDQATSLT